MSIPRPLQLLALCAAVALSGGCPTPTAAPDVGSDSPPADAPTSLGRLYVVRAMSVPSAASEGRTPGFDLDGRQTSSATPGDCRDAHLDFVSPLGVAGVDNQFVGALVGLIRGFVPTFDPQMAMDGQIARGAFVLGLVLHDVDSLAADPGVTFDVVLLKTPECRSDRCEVASVAAGTSWITRGTPLARGLSASITGGRLRGVIPELPLEFNVGSLPVAITLRGATIEADVAESGMTRAAMGGHVLTEDVVRLAEQLRPGVGPLVNTALRNVADMAPDASGSCLGVSLGAGFEAVPGTMVVR